MHYEVGYLPNVTINEKRLGIVKYKNIDKYVYDTLDETDYVFDNDLLDKEAVKYEFANKEIILNSNYGTYLKSLFLGVSFDLEVLKTIDADKVILWVDTYNKDAIMPKSAYIEKKETFVIVPEIDGTMLDINKFGNKHISNLIK